MILRTNMPRFGKRTPLTEQFFDGFIKAYGDDPYGNAKRKDEGDGGCFRKFSRKEITARGDNLDISWLRVGNSIDHDLLEPDEIANQIGGNLLTALNEMKSLQALLNETFEVKE